MTSPPDLPEVFLPRRLRAAFDEAASAYASVDDAELRALAGDLREPPAESDEWLELRSRIARMVGLHGYVVVRGLGLDEGRSLLLLATAAGRRFATYAPGRIVKRFRMSPWTNELSHTLAAGSFHTDGNVSAVPPAATAMQCEVEDPGGSEYAELRVAHLPLLLRRLGEEGADGAAALKFLRDEDVTMAHPRSARLWRGRIVEDGRIRFHPESLRVATTRRKLDPAALEGVLATVHQAALDVSPPFHTTAGDVLLVSNTRALHYRGACSVRFTRFPTEFEARSLLVLHRMDADV